jgi:hypothetical protein
VTVVRQAIAVVLSLGLVAASVGAPFVHAHPDDHVTDHHEGQAVHAHWSGHAHHAVDGPALEAEDHDRAVSVNAFIAVAAASFSVPALTHLAFELPVPIERPAHRRIDVVRSHDPPASRLRSPRAPPFSLS